MSEKEQYIKYLPISDKIECSYILTKEDVLSEEGLLLIESLIRDGLTFEAVADTLGIKPQTFWNWRKKYPQLDNACKKGKKLVDYKVENALLKAALGYKTRTVKVTSGKIDKFGNVETVVEKTETETGPNVTACLAWLNNRKPEQWRKNRDSVLELDDKESGITINIIKGEKDDE